jgi:hypothetical protein
MAATAAWNPQASSIWKVPRPLSLVAAKGMSAVSSSVRIGPHRSARISRGGRRSKLRIMFRLEHFEWLARLTLPCKALNKKLFIRRKAGEFA